jgi:2-amino-4-hydroxy-6-hydroxymethyldihydropteridine diphosphokinase
VRTPAEIGLSLGSNLGDRMAHLRAGRDSIAALSGLRLLAQSPVYETEPVDVRPEHADLAFLNVVIVVACSLEPSVLAKELRRIEREAGRVRSADRNAPRPLDADILYAGNRSLRTPWLRVPHPRWAGRRFVVEPLADVRPDLILPGQEKPVCEILAALPARPKAKVYRASW